MHRLRAAWLNLSPRRKAAIAAAAIGLLSLLFFVQRGSNACTMRSDAEDRLAAVMQDLNTQASSGTLSLEDLARRVSDINTAAAALDQSADPQAYCDAIEAARTGKAR